VAGRHYRFGKTQVRGRGSLQEPGRGHVRAGRRAGFDTYRDHLARHRTTRKLIRPGFQREPIRARMILVRRESPARDKLCPLSYIDRHHRSQIRVRSRAIAERYRPGHAAFGCSVMTRARGSNYTDSCQHGCSVSLSGVHEPQSPWTTPRMQRFQTVGEPPPDPARCSGTAGRFEYDGKVMAIFG
jgi:hypothetical protein